MMSRTSGGSCSSTNVGGTSPSRASVNASDSVISIGKRGPTSISRSRMPSENTSLRASPSRPRAISGAIDDALCAIARIDRTLDPHRAAPASPKSVSFTSPNDERSTWCAARSRCVTLVAIPSGVVAWCAPESPSATSVAMKSARSSGSRRTERACASSRRASVTPSTSSSTIAAPAAASSATKSKTHATFGWRTEAMRCAARASVTIAASGSSHGARSKSFTATARRMSPSSTPRNTAALPPRPISSWTRTRLRAWSAIAAGGGGCRGVADGMRGRGLRAVGLQRPNRGDVARAPRSCAGFAHGRMQARAGAGGPLIHAVWCVAKCESRRAAYAARAMREAAPPRVHLFVCANRRDASSPLGPGCGDAGDAVYAAMKDEVAARGAYRDAWVTRTYCIGVCPKRGCTVAIYPRGRVVAEVTVDGARALFEEATR